MPTLSPALCMQLQHAWSEGPSQAAPTAASEALHHQLRGLLENGDLALAEVDHAGWTPLHYIVFSCHGHGDDTWLRALLQEHPKAAAVATPEGWLPLHFAAAGMGGQLHVAAKYIRTLLKFYTEGAAVPTSEGLLPLHIAVKSMVSGGEKAEECLQLLLQAHPPAALERTNDGLLPLHLAAQWMGAQVECATCVQLLLQTHPSAAQERDKDGNTPLHLLAASTVAPKAAFVRFFAAAHPDALHAHDNNGRTPLELAQLNTSLPEDAVEELQRLTIGETKQSALPERRCPRQSQSPPSPLPAVLYRCLARASHPCPPPSSASLRHGRHLRPCDGRHGQLRSCSGRRLHSGQPALYATSRWQVAAGDRAGGGAALRCSPQEPTLGPSCR